MSDEAKTVDQYKIGQSKEWGLAVILQGDREIGFTAACAELNTLAAENARLREALTAIADGSIENVSTHEHASTDVRNFARNALK